MPAPTVSPPNPNDIRRQYLLDSNGLKGPGDGGGIAPGQAMAASTTYGAVIPIAGSAKVRLRARTTVATTLRAKYLLADGTESASADNPADVALAANTEASMNLSPSGEGQLHVQIINGVTPGAITFVDVSQL